MISKCVGIALMIVGGMMAWGYLWPLLASMMTLVWLVFKLGVTLFVAYVGYRLWRQRYMSNA